MTHKFSYTSKSLYDLNSLLTAANVLICVLISYLYFTTGNTDYVNIFTVFLVYLFAIENIGMLVYEKKRRNPFIIILVLVVTLFYMIRIATLIISPSSAMIFQVASIMAKDLNYALIFILFANASIFLGFYIGNKNNIIRKNILCEDNHAPKLRNALIIITFLILIDFFSVINQELFGRLTGFIQTLFFNQHIILLLTFAMLSYHYKKISLQYRILFIFIFLSMIVLLTLSGSRSAFLVVGMSILMGILAVKQRILISKKAILIGLMIIPVAMIFFVTATFKRALDIKDTITIEHLSMAKDYEMLSSDAVDKSLDLIYYRLGFLDWSTELISNRQTFASIINGQYYVESIIDNVLTPGFDVFGVPTASNALSYVRNGLPIPHKDQISEAYQSDQLGIYGEYYVLFYGYPALIVFFISAFAFQRIFVSFKTKNVLLNCLYRVVLLNLFYVWMNSFGMDWFALDIVSTIITTVLFARYYVSDGTRKIVLGLNRKRILDLPGHKSTT
jgi:hypothetical protein